MSDISTDAGVPLDFGVCVEDGASAAARSQPAGSNLPKLPQAGMKRRLTGRSEPSAVKPRDDSVAHREAAPQNSIHNGDSPSEDAGVIAQPAPDSVSDSAVCVAEVGTTDQLENALEDLLEHIRIGCPSHPAPHQRQPLVSKVRFGLLERLCSAVDTVLQKRASELPQERRLRPKACACG